MPWALLLRPTVLLGIALAAASAFGWLQTVRLGAAQDRVQAITATFGAFKAHVATEGQIAQQKADTQAKADKQRQEKANEDFKRARALDSQRIASLRYDRDHSGSYQLPAASPDAARPDIACFDRRSFELASGTALAGLREILDQCDAAIISLNVAKAWAQSK